MDEEAFDVDAFCETLFAYMPSTEVIPPIEITVRTLYTIMKKVFFLNMSYLVFSIKNGLSACSEIIKRKQLKEELIF